MRGIVKHRVVAVVLLVLGALFATVGLLPSASATTLYVGGTGPGNFTTIQGAIDAANPGDAIFVYKGTYYENVVIDKTLTLVGENRNTTTIDGRGIGDVLLVSANWVNITGFNITNSGTGWNVAGLELEHAMYCEVTNITAWSNYDGILLDASRENVIRDNVVYSNTYVGIALSFSHNNSVTNNIVHSNAHVGIGLSYSDWNDIRGNMIWNSSGGIGIFDSEAASITENTMVGSGGVRLRANELKYTNTHFIDPSNTVNGKPVYYFKNVNGGTIPSGAAQVILAECNDVTVENQNLSNVVDGVTVFHSSGIAILNNTIESNSWNGIYARQSHDMLIENNTVSHGHHGIRLMQSDRGIIRRNVVGDGQSSGLGIQITYGQHTSVESNQLEDSIYLERTSQVRLHNNTMIDEGIAIWGDAMKYWNTHDIDTTNTINGKPVHYWSNCDGGKIPPGAGQVILANCTNVIVENQELSCGYDGIELYMSDGIVIKNNTITANKRYGIYSEYSKHSEIRNNTISSHGLEGILATGYDYGLISNNTISYNRVGISLRGTFTAAIANNTIARNEKGIYMVDVYSAHVFHNDFIDNDLHWFDDVYYSDWDDGYPSGGNYWSNYTGNDDKSGPNQDLPGGDGIGDTPLKLGYYTYDHYPLMYPYNSWPTFPSRPLDLEATADFQRIAIVWKEPARDGGSPITNYTIYRGYAPGAERFLVEVGNVTTYMDTGLERGKTYYYRVAAKNAIDEGPKSNEASATVPVALRPPLDDVRVPWINISLNWTGPQPPIPGGGSQTPSRSPAREIDRLDLSRVSRQEPNLEHESVSLHCIVLSVEECMDSLLEAVQRAEIIVPSPSRIGKTVRQ